MRKLFFIIPLLVLISISIFISGYVERPKTATTTSTTTTTVPKESALATELGLPEGYKAEFLLKPDLLSPLFITATSDDQLLVAEHYGGRLLRINPLTAKIDVLYNLPRGEWNALLSDGADGAYMVIGGKLAHIDGNGTYTVYSDNYINPTALGPNGEIYGYTKSGYTKSDVLVLQSKDENQRPSPLVSQQSLT